MSDNFKLDINIPQKKIEEMAKQVIREIVEEKIQIVMQKIDIEKVIKDKLNTLDTKLSKMTKEEVSRQVDSLSWSMRDELRKGVRKLILEEIQKKPLTGNVYLKVNGYEVETDID